MYIVHTVYMIIAWLDSMAAWNPASRPKYKILFVYALALADTKGIYKPLQIHGTLMTCTVYII